MPRMMFHQFPNDDVLILENVDSYAGLHGLTVYTVHYAEKDGDEYRGCGSENFMSQAEAVEAFDKRIASNDPAKPTSPHNDIYNIVVDAFQRYLGEHSFRPVDPPKDWEGFAAHVVEKTFGGSGQGNFEAVLAALDGLTNTSSKDTEGRSDVMVELPAWKVLEMVTTIAALGMVVRQHNEMKLHIAA